MSNQRRQRGDLAIGIRTLIASGYLITDATTHPRHIEVSCSRTTSLGAEVRMLIAFTSEPALSMEEMDGLRHEARRNNRSTLIVADRASDETCSWDEFFRALGGEIPSWRALSSEYSAALMMAARNELPPSMEGEAWMAFELLVREGFEFIFGRRVRHLGGIRRGSPVADLLAQMPDGRILVIDAKATGDAFDARLPELRPLGEYVERQVQRQQGQDVVHAAAVVSSQFQQRGEVLLDTAMAFRVEHGIPVAFVEAKAIVHLVEQLATKPQIRGAIRWAHLFRGGSLKCSEFDREVEAVGAERISEGP